MIVSIFDMSGKKYLNKVIPTFTPEYTCMLDVSFLAKGIYIVKCNPQSLNNYPSYFKIIKE